MELADYVELPRWNCRDSHVLPKWTYKRVRDPQSSKPDPIHVTHGKAYPTSRQEKKHFLCSPCEIKLNPSETLVARLAVQPDGSFPFATTIGPVEGIVGDGVALVATAHGNRELLAYFALSVIWRSDVMTRWIDLGCTYRESIRNYLLNKEHFPDHVYVVVSALRSAPGSFDLDKLVTSPFTRRFPQYRLHAFIVCGLEFLVAVGQTTPAWVREVCLHRAPRELALRVVSRSSMSASGFVRSAAEAIHNQGRR